MSMAYLDIRDLQGTRREYDTLNESRSRAVDALVLACYRLLDADDIDAERHARDDIRTALKALTREPS